MFIKRIHLIEIHDQHWCPRTVRDGETDYLQFAIATTKLYSVMVPNLAAALQRTGTRQVLDLCSAHGAPNDPVHSSVPLVTRARVPKEF